MAFRKAVSTFSPFTVRWNGIDSLFLFGGREVLNSRRALGGKFRGQVPAEEYLPFQQTVSGFVIVEEEAMTRTTPQAYSCDRPPRLLSSRYEKWQSFVLFGSRAGVVLCSVHRRTES
jgi:hypothetical protein